MSLEAVAVKCAAFNLKQCSAEIRRATPHASKRTSKQTDERAAFLADERALRKSDREEQRSGRAIKEWLEYIGIHEYCSEY